MYFFDKVIDFDKKLKYAIKEEINIVTIYFLCGIKCKKMTNYLCYMFHIRK